MLRYHLWQMAAVLQRHALQVVAASTTARQGSFRVAPRLQSFAVVHSHHHFMQRHACSALRKVNVAACLEGIAPMHGLTNAGGPQMMVPTSAHTFPEGMMNVHDAT